MQYPKLTLILGGAASGKSSFAEKCVIQTGLPRSYLATAQAFDDEMADKIKQHQIDRGSNWATTEVPIDLPEAVSAQPKDHVILIDCLTLWVTNLMLADKDCDTAAQALFSAIQSRNAPRICRLKRSWSQRDPRNVTRAQISTVARAPECANGGTGRFGLHGHRGFTANPKR